MKPQVLLFLTTLAGWMNRGQQQVIEYLVEENRVLKEHLVGKCPNLTVAQRRRLASKGRKLGRAVLANFPHSPKLSLRKPPCNPKVP